MGFFSFRKLGIFGYFFRRPAFARTVVRFSRFSFRGLGIARRSTSWGTSAKSATSHPVRSSSGRGSRSTASTRSSGAGSRSTHPRRRNTRRSGGWWGRARHSRSMSQLGSESLEKRSLLAGDTLAAITPDLAAASDLGFSNSDDITSAATLTINVDIPVSTVLNPGDELRLFQNGALTPIATATAGYGLNSFTISRPALDGAYSYTAALFDAAGPTPALGTASSALAVTVDATAPTVTGLTVPGAQLFITGDEMDFFVDFSESVYTVGSPALPISIGSGFNSPTAPDVARDAVVLPINPMQVAQTQQFYYVVGSLVGNKLTSESTDADGVEIAATGLSLDNANDIRDLAGNRVAAAIPAQLRYDANVAMSYSVFVNVSNTAVATFYDPFDNPVATPAGQLEPRVTPLPNLTIRFTDKVTGEPQAVPFPAGVPGSPPSPPYGTGVFTIEDFVLTRNGVVVPIAGAVRLTCPLFGSDAFATYQLSGLENVTDAPGAYALTFSDIGLADSATVSWVKNYETPSGLRATFTTNPVTTSGLIVTPLDSVTVRFTDAFGAANGVYDPDDVTVPVTGVTVNARPSAEEFLLYRNGVLVPGFNTNPAITIQGSGNTYTITGLSAVTDTVGSYELRLLSTGNSIRGLQDDDVNPNGATLKDDETTTWQYFHTTVDTVTVISTPPNGTTYKVGDVIEFAVSFVDPDGNPQNVNVAPGTAPALQFTMSSPATVVSAAYNSGSGTSTLTFHYTVQPGDLDTDGIVMIPLIDGATNITDTSGTLIFGTFVPPTSVVTVDGQAPAVTSVSLPFGAYVTGDTLSISVNFDDAVYYTRGQLNDATITLTIGSTVFQFTYVSGSGTNSLVFETAPLTPNIQIDSTVGFAALGPIIFYDSTIADINGNVTAAAYNTNFVLGGGSIVINIDTLAPTAPAIATAINNLTLATIANGGATNDNAPTLSGTAEANSTVSVFANGGLVPVAVVTADIDGIWTATLPTLVDGLYSFTAVATDADGNASAASPIPYSLTIDSVRPTITGISAPAGFYHAYESVVISVAFSEVVQVTGSPQLNILVGSLSNSLARTADYLNATSATVNGVTTTTLQFLYTPTGAEMNDVDGVRIVSLALNGGSIQDLVTNDAILALPTSSLPSNVAILVSEATPVFSLIPNAKNNPRATPVSVVTVVFNQPVSFFGDTVNGDGCLSLADFELTRNGTVVPFPANARLIRSSTNYQDFELSNLSSVTDAPGTYILTFADRQIGLRATTTWIKTETPAQLTATISLSPTSAVSPRITPVDSATITFSQNVDNVDLTDFVLRKDGAKVSFPAGVVVLSGSGAAYTITGLKSLTSAPGAYSITLLADDQATPPPAIESDIATYAGGQLIAPVDSNWTYDPQPTIVSVTAPTPPPTGFFRTGNPLTFTVKFSEPVFLTNTNSITLPITLGTKTVAASYISGDTTDTLTFRYAVQAGDEDLDGIVLTGTIDTGAAGTVKDHSGANAVLVFSQPDTSLDLVDAVAPSLNPVVVGPADGFYVVNKSLQFTATFSEAMRVTGTPRIALTVGTTTRYAEYISGSETQTLVFQYNPTLGDSDLNGIVAANVISLNGGTITDLAGNGCGLTFTTLNLSNVLIDTVAPNAPTLALGIGVANGATQAEATQTSGVVTVIGEAGAAIVVTFTNGANSVSKTITGTGSVQPVVLLAADLSNLGNGVIAVSATQTDAAGNAQTAPAATTSFTLDTVAPNAPVITAVTDDVSPVTGTVANNGRTNDTQPVLTGTTEANTTVRIFNGTTSLGSATVSGTSWTFTPVLADGATYVFKAVASDTAGNTSPDSATYTVSVDTVAPNAPTLALGLGVADGATQAEAIQASGVVTVLGESGATITVTFTNGANTVTKTVTGTGSAQPVTLLAADVTKLTNGTISVSATQTDAAGNVSSAGTTSFTLDTVAPNAPTLVLGSGVANGATQTEATQSSGVVTVAGDSGAAIVVTFTNGANTVTKNVTGTGSAQPVVLLTAELTTLGNGTIGVSATQADAAGNVSPAATTSFTLDTVIPNAPTLALGSGVAGGASQAEATQASGVVTVSGDSGAAIVVTFTNGANTVTKPLTGTGSAQPVVLELADLTKLGDGTISVSATQTDAAGNAQTAPAATISFTLDTIAPNAPTLALGSGVANGATQAEASQATGVVTVTGDNGTAIIVTFKNGANTVTKNLTGTGAAQPVVLDVADITKLGNGTISVSATQQDTVGNVSPAATTSFTLDTVVPNAPTLALGTGVANGATQAEATQVSGVVTVLGESGASIVVTFTNGGISIPKYLTGTGSAQPVVLLDADLTTLGNGTISVTATQQDTAGNISTVATKSFTLDTVAPNAPTLALGSGVADGATRAEATQASGVVTVLGESGAAITVTFTNGANTVTKPLTGTGSAQPVTLLAADLTTLGNGTISVSATQTDAAGNPQTAPAATTSFTLDTIAPNAPTLALGAGVTGGATQAEAIQASGVVTVLGESGAAITVTFANGANTVIKILVGTGSAQAVTLELADLAKLGDGTISVSATQTDVAGNPQTAPAATTSFTLDTIAPNAPTLALGTGVGNGATQAEATQVSGVVTVIGNAGAVITVTFTKGANTVIKTVTGTGSVQAVTLDLADLTKLGNGTISVSATQADTAGNVSSAGTTSFQLDTVVPNAPTLALGAGVIGGATQAEAIQASGVVTVLGETGAPITVTFTNGGNTVTKTVTGTGSAQPVVLLEADRTTLGDGTISVSATQTDAAGNPQTAPAAATSLTHDTVAPTVVSFASSVPDGVYLTGAVIPLTATLSEDVQAGGAITVKLTTGATVTLRAESQGKTLTGIYTVRPGDVTQNLNVESFQLTAPPVLDLAGNPMTSTTLPDPIRILAAVKSIVVDGSIKASATGFSSNPTVIADKKVVVRAVPITFTAPVTGVTLANFRLRLNGRSVSLKGATLTGSGANYILRLPPNVARFKGLYCLQIVNTSSIRAIERPEAMMTQPADICWGYGKSIGIAPLAKAARRV